MFADYFIVQDLAISNKVGSDGCVNVFTNYASRNFIFRNVEFLECPNVALFLNSIAKNVTVEGELLSLFSLYCFVMIECYFAYNATGIVHAADTTDEGLGSYFLFRSKYVLVFLIFFSSGKHSSDSKWSRNALFVAYNDSK